MIRNRRVILPFLLLAWTIIFAHSIIPHHHHLGRVHSEKAHQSHSHHHTFDFSTEYFGDCDDDCHDHTCHFHIDVLTQISVDKVFISNVETDFYSYKPLERKQQFIYISEIFFEQIPKTNYLRGPPYLS